MAVAQVLLRRKLADQVVEREQRIMRGTRRASRIISLWQHQAIDMASSPTAVAVDKGMDKVGTEPAVTTAETESR